MVKMIENDIHFRLLRFSIRIKCVEIIEFNRDRILFIDQTLDVIKLGLSHPDLYIGSTLDYHRYGIRNLDIT